MMRWEKEKKKRRRESYLLFAIAPAHTKASSPMSAAIPIGVRAYTTRNIRPGVGSPPLEIANLLSYTT